MRRGARSFLVVSVFLLALLPLMRNPGMVYADPGNFSVTFDSANVKPGQQDVPMYIHINSNGSDVSFAGCELVVDADQATFSHSLDDNASFTSDFSGPNGSFASGGPDETAFYTSVGANPAVAASSNIETYVMFYDISASATGTINVSFDTADTGSCLISDENSTPLSTVNGTSGTLNVSGVTVTESGGSTNVTEGGATDTYQVVLNAQPSSNVTINITDDAQTNVSASSLVFTNSNWSTPQTVTVSAQNDSSIEGDHTGTITMAVNGSSNSLYTGLTVASVTVNVTDNDGLIAEFLTASASDNEDTGGSLPQLRVSGGNTTGGSAQTIQVTVTGGTATGGGSDYTFTSPTTVTIPAANYTSGQTINITGLSIASDATVEANETIIFGLANPSSGVVVGDADGASGTESVHTYTINNDDGLLVELSAATASDNEATGGNVPTLTISGADTTGGSDETVDVTILGSSTANGSDYTLASATVTIPADDYSTPQNISLGLTISEDATVEANDTINLSLGSPSGGISVGDANGNSTTQSTSTYTITNDDELTAEFEVTSASGGEATGANIPEILISGDSDVATTIRVDDLDTGTASSATDYTITDPVDVPVPAASYDGTTATSIAVPMTITNDQVAEVTETINLSLSAPASNVSLADLDAANGTESSHTYSITDNDTLTVEFNLAADANDEDSGYTPQLRIGGAIISSPATVQVTVTGGTATGGGSDYSFTSPTTVTIPIGNYTSGTTLINVTGLSIGADSLIEANETIIFGLQSPSSAITLGDADGANGNESALTYTINNDDGLLVEFTTGAASDNENTGGNVPQVVVSGADTTGGADETVEVTVTGGTATGGGDDYAFTDPQTITIPAGDYTSPQTIAIPTLSIVGDTNIEAHETITFGLQNPSANLTLGNADGDATNDSTHTYTINNDDGLLVEFTNTAASDSEATGGNLPQLRVSGADITGGGGETVDVIISGSSTANGSDYALASTTVTIPAADYTTPQSISIGLSITNNAVVEANDTIIMDLGNESAGVSIGDADGATGIEDSHTYTITNDDSMTVELSAATASDDEATGGNIPVVLVNGSSDIATTATVDDSGTGTATGGGNDYTFTDPTTVSIPAGSYDGTVGTGRSINLTIVDDSTTEPDETAVFTLAAATGTTLGDASGAGGTISGLTYTIQNDDVNSADTDNDGISDDVEDDGPNGGDANDDGTPDSQQDYVTTIFNSVAGGYLTLDIGNSAVCTAVDGLAVTEESGQSSQDEDYDYPYGLIDFDLTCASAGVDHSVTIILDEDYDTSDWVFRKLNRGTGEYSAFNDPEINTMTRGSERFTTLFYTLTDGGSDDEDGTANGVIVDPLGIAEGSALAETGSNIQYPLLIGSSLMALGWILSRFTFKRYRFYR